MAANRRAESARDPIEIVRIARHDEVGTSERPGDDNGVNDIARTGPRANGAGRARSRLVEILDDAAVQKTRSRGLRSTAPGLRKHGRRHDGSFAAQQRACMEDPQLASIGLGR
jgi:hypothetical protein